MHLSQVFGTQSYWPGLVGFWLIVLLSWSLVWKGLALWRAARRGENAWFIILLLLNTVGILEIIYYFLIAKTDKKK
jgi:methionyl-tRNA synthetase